jgi:betaine-aldehyde dehydrogenase
MDLDVPSAGAVSRTAVQLPTQKLHIGGRLVDAVSGETFATLNPATGERICEVQQAGAEDVERAVAAAQEGFRVWSRMTGTERGRILNRAAAILRERNRELAKLEVLDTGKPLQEAIAVDVLSGADCIEYFAGLAATISGQHIELSDAFAYTRREPLGICVGIGAWNYPIQIACWKSAPARRVQRGAGGCPDGAAADAAPGGRKGVAHGRGRHR